MTGTIMKKYSSIYRRSIFTCKTQLRNAAIPKAGSFHGVERAGEKIDCTVKLSTLANFRS